MSDIEQTAPIEWDPSQQWSVLAANAVGASHQATGRPGQDAFDFGPSDHTTDPPLAVAVADGHGHRIHFRSKEGSRFAVEVACDTALHEAEALGACRSVEDVRSHTLNVVLPRVVEAWRDACDRDLQGRPVTLEELEAVGFPEEERAGALDENDPLLAYGSTLMFAGLAGPWLLLAHIGDGDIFIVEADGTAAIPVPAIPSSTASARPACANRTPSGRSASRSSTYTTKHRPSSPWPPTATELPKAATTGNPR